MVLFDEEDFNVSNPSPLLVDQIKSLRLSNPDTASIDSIDIGNVPTCEAIDLEAEEHQFYKALLFLLGVIKKGDVIIG